MSRADPRARAANRKRSAREAVGEPLRRMRQPGNRVTENRELRMEDREPPCLFHFRFSVTRLPGWFLSSQLHPLNSLPSLLSIHSLHLVARYFPRTANLSRPRGMNAFAQLAPSSSHAVLRVRHADRAGPRGAVGGAGSPRR